MLVKRRFARRHLPAAVVQHERLAGGQPFDNAVDRQDVGLREILADAQPPAVGRARVRRGDAQAGFDHGYVRRPIGEHLVDAWVVQEGIQVGVRQEQQCGHLHHMPVLLAPLHARHPARKGFVLLDDGLIEDDLPAQRIGPIVKLLAEGGVVILEQHAAHFLQRHAIAAQHEAVQQPARFTKGIITVAVLGDARRDEAKLLVMLEKVGVTPIYRVYAPMR